MSFIDKISEFIHESSYQMTNYNDPMYAQLRGFHAIDKPVGGGSSVGGTASDQVNNQINKTYLDRKSLFQQIDLIRNHHIAITIKDIIIDDCFNSMCDKRLASIQYRSDDEELNELVNSEIDKLLTRTMFLEMFKDCLINEGIDYGEMFMSTKCEIGRGIVEISDNIDVAKHIAIYKNLSPIGFVKLDERNTKVTPKDYISSDDISHFLISPKKIPLRIIENYTIETELAEKIRCALPILAPVVDLIIQYNQLEQISTAVEINKALAPIILGVGISPSSDINEIRSNLQQWQIALNSSRNSIINNLQTLDVKQLLQKMNEIKLVPYNVEEGTNRMSQITIEHVQSDLTEKINNTKRTIALAVGVPESALASTVVKEKKEDNILSNPRYSRMLSGIQQSLGRGVVEFIYKHLKFRFTKLDSAGKQFIERKIDRNLIDVKFKSVTNVDDRLDNENMLLTAETIGNLTGIIDVVTGSPNLPVKTNADKFLALWQSMTENNPVLREIFEIDHTLEGDGVEEDEIEPRRKITS